MKDQRKDKIEQVKEFRVALDKEALWAELEARQKKEKKGGFVWFFPALLFAVSLIIWIVYPSKISKKEYSELSAISATRTDNEISRETQQSASSSEASVISNKLNQNSELVAESRVQETKKSETGQVDFSKSNIKTNTVVSIENRSTSRTSLESFSDQEILELDQADLVRKEIARKASTTKSQLNQSLLTKNVLTEKILESIFPLQRLQTLMILLEGKNDNLLASPSFEFSSEIKIPKHSKKRLTNPFFELQASIGFVSRDLADSIDPTSNYPSIRATTEAPLEAINLSLKYGKNLGNGFFATTGINYHQITEKFSYSIPTSETLVTMENIITDIFIDAGGQRFETRGQGQGISRTHMTYAIYNRLRSFSIPLHLGYRMVINKWSIGVQAGAHASLAFSFKGTLLDSDLQLNSNPSYFKDRLGLSWSGGIDIGYNLGEDWSLFMSPTYRSIPNLIDSNESSLNQNYKSFSLGLGLRYTMKK